MTTKPSLAVLSFDLHVHAKKASEKRIKKNNRSWKRMAEYATEHSHWRVSGADLRDFMLRKATGDCCAAMQECLPEDFVADVSSLFLRSMDSVPGRQLLLSAVALLAGVKDVSFLITAAERTHIESLLANHFPDWSYDSRPCIKRKTFDKIVPWTVIRVKQPEGKDFRVMVKERRLEYVTGLKGGDMSPVSVDRTDIVEVLGCVDLTKVGG